jgi:hypothetical protein
MLANVLNSELAVEASVQVVRAFVRLREILASNRELEYKFAELERHVANHDEQIQAIFEAIRQLLNPPEPERKQIGFHAKEGKLKYALQKKRRQ